MAGDWIKMRKTLPTDPRIVRIMSALKADRFRTLGGVLSAWCLFDDQTEDGRLDGYTPEVFDEVVGFPGLARAMASVGWLEIGDDYLKAPRFSEHNGHSAKRRAQENVRKMSARDADKKRTESALEKRREEKRREDTNKQNHPFLEDEEFATLFDAFKSSSSKTHNWFPGEEIFDSWMYDLTRNTISDAKKILRFSTSKGAKTPILNGDHKPRSHTSRQKVDLTLGPDD